MHGRRPWAVQPSTRRDTSQAWTSSDSTTMAGALPPLQVCQPWLVAAVVTLSDSMVWHCTASDPGPGEGVLHWAPA